jgi:hypothetical protein
MLDDAGSIAFAGVCAFGAITISIFQVGGQAESLTERKRPPGLARWECRC